MSIKLPKGTLWITRDEVDDGTALESYVEIWTSRPECLNGVWIGFDEHNVLSKLTAISVEQCRAEFGVVPETVRECIRVER